MEINSENYVVINGWMVEELKLKNPELMIYAIIYGFSQDKSSRFTGSAQYLADWTGVSKRTVFTALKSLLDKKLLKKYEEEQGGMNLISYKAVLPDSLGMKKFHGGDEKFSLGGSEKISPNNIDIDNLVYKDIKKDISNDISKEKDFLFANEVILYLNSKANKKFRTNTKAYIRLINARRSEGYTIADFKHVIDVKCAEWMNTDHEQYLRPDTLFAPSHFDSYLNQKIVKAKPKSAIYFSNDECREQMKNETPTF